MVVRPPLRPSRQLMAFLGLVLSERSTGDTRHRGGITKTGNIRTRMALVEGAWTYRHPADIGEAHQRRQVELPEQVRDIAWKAQASRIDRGGRKWAPPAVASVVQGWRRSHGGEFPWLPFKAGSKPMPVPRLGPAPDEVQKGGNQSALQSWSTDVQRLRLLPCMTSSLLPITRRQCEENDCDLNS